MPFRIFQFENFGRTRKRVLAESTVCSPDEDEAIVGMFVSLLIKDVPRHLFNSWKEKNEKLSAEKKVIKLQILAESVSSDGIQSQRKPALCLGLKFT